MATTEHFYSGTGSNTSFPFEFPYLTESDVFVELYNSSTGNFDLLQQNTSGQNNDYSISNTNIVFNVAPPNIANVNNIHIYRNTDVETAKAVYGTGSAIRAQDLNDNTNQSLYKLQEGAQLITTGDIKDEAIDSSKIKEGTIVNIDISPTAEIAVSKLADGSARQLLQTDAAGTGVEWASNIDIPGTLDVTGNVDLDANLNVDGATTLDSTTVDGVLDINGSATIDNVQIDSNEINTTSGNLTIDSASGTTTVDDHLNVTGNLNITGSFAAGTINATTLGNLGVGSFLRADANDESTAGTYTLRGPSTGSSSNRAKIQGRDLELVFGLGNQDQAQTMQISAQRHGIVDGLSNSASINDINLGAGNLGLPHGSTELNSTSIGHVARISLGRAYMTVAKPNNVYSTNHIVMRASYPDGLMFYHPDTSTPGAYYTSTSGGNSYDQNITAARNAADMRIITGGILAKNKVEIGSSSVTGTLQISGTDVTSTAAEINILDGVTTNTSELNKLDGFTGSTADLNEVVTGKNVVETITGSATDTQLPTAQAVNERIVELVTEVGGFHPIANETSFPTTNPDINDGAGTIVSLKALSSAFSTGSGVTTHTFTNGAGSGNNVIINGLPASTTFQAGKGLLLETTSTLHTYNYHRLVLDESGVSNADALVSAFNERYYGPYAANQSTRPSGANRVNGDLYFNTSDGKMKVWNGSHASGTWDDVAAPGNFFINTLSSSSGSGGGQSAFNGVATRFTLSNPPLTAQQLLVSVNGVIQKPNSGTSPSEGFAIDGADIIFASAPTTSAPYFIVTIGSSVNIGTPSNNTVGAAHIIDGSISNAEISSSAAIASSKLAKPIDFADNEKARFGNNQDLQIYHDGSDSWIRDTGTGMLRVDGSQIQFRKYGTSEILANFIQDGAVELYYDNTKRLETTAIGVTISGDLKLPDGEELRLGDGNDLQLYHDGSNSYIVDSGTGELRLDSNSLRIRNAAGTETSAVFVQDGACELRYDNVKKFETTSDGATVSGDLTIDGSTPELRMKVTDDSQSHRINFYNTADSIVSRIFAEPSGNISIRNGTNAAEECIKCLQNGAVEVYYDNSKKLETQNTGIHVTGDISLTGDYLADDNEKLKMGDGFDLQIYHDGNHSYLDNAGTGNIHIRGNGTNEVKIQAKNGEQSIICKPDAAVELYYDNSKKFETLLTGTRTNGNIQLPFVNGNNGLRNKLSWVTEANYFDETAYIAVDRTATSGAVSDIVFANGSVNAVSEKLRITSDGDILIGCTSKGNDYAYFEAGDNNRRILQIGTNTTSAKNVVIFRNPNNDVGRIQTTGSTCSYLATSDYRLKENVIAISDGITRLKTLKPSRFNFKVNKDTTVDGFLAHEVTAVPEAISGEKDAVKEDGSIDPQGIDQSKLVPLLTAALQEAITKIETLETKVAALEAA